MLPQRFYDKLDTTDPNKCWIWQGSTSGWNYDNGGGYGQIYYNYQRWSTHRLSYTLHKGPIPKGLNVCHTCDNTRCCNPDHMFLGTTRANVDDKVMKQRQTMGSDIHCAKLNEQQVLEIKQRLKQGEKAKSIAADYPCSPWTVNSIKRGELWKHVECH